MKHPSGGFTLIEAMIAMVIFTVALLAIGALGVAGSRFGSVSLGQAHATQRARARLMDRSVEGWRHWAVESQAMPNGLYEKAEDALGVQSKVTLRNQPLGFARRGLAVEVELQWENGSQPDPYRLFFKGWSPARPVR